MGKLRLLAFSRYRAVPLATAAHPAEVLALAESIDRGKLAHLPALILAWALTIALGDLGHPLQAAAAADDGVALGASSPEAAIQATTLVLFDVQALILGGHIPQALTIAKHTAEQWADGHGALCKHLPTPSTAWQHSATATCRGWRRHDTGAWTVAGVDRDGAEDGAAPRAGVRARSGPGCARPRLRRGARTAPRRRAPVRDHAGGVGDHDGMLTQAGRPVTCWGCIRC